MRGHLVQRYEGTWSIVLDLGRQRDPRTGKVRRVQKWFSMKGTKKEAEAVLNEKINAHNKGLAVDPSKVLLGDWLDRWLDTAVRPTQALRTYETYKSLIVRHLKPKLGQYRLCELRPDHLDEYYLASPLNPKTLENHHHVLHRALAAAVRYKMIQSNAAAVAMHKPKAQERPDAIEAQCWDVDEARRFLATADAAGPQPAAFYRLAIETGMRKGELCGVQWRDLNWETGQVTVARQLVKRWPAPIFSTPKRKQTRTIDLSPGLVVLLRKQKRAQAEVRLLAGTAYQDHGVIFAYEEPPFGMPLSANNIGQREYSKLIQAAKVRPITFHGMRHTAATLMLKEGIPIKVVSERLGHKEISITLDIYTHALPSMQQDAAVKFGALLGGAGG